MGTGKKIWVLWVACTPVVIALCVASGAIPDPTTKSEQAPTEVFKVFAPELCPRCCSERDKPANSSPVQRLTVRLAPAMITPEGLREFRAFLEKQNAQGAACLNYAGALHVIFPQKASPEKFARAVDKNKGYRAELNNSD